MFETFLFDLPPTLNEIINLARANRYGSAKEKRRWTNTIACECHGRQCFPGKVWIEFVWKVKSFGCDPDNTAAAAKFCLDGLVEAGIIQRDNLTIIMSPVLHWYEKGNNSVEIRIASYPIWNGSPASFSGREQ